jgi:hypothetical protein
MFKLFSFYTVIFAVSSVTSEVINMSVLIF